MSNPLAGLASVMEQLAAAFRPPVITPLATYKPNRAQRRHMRQPTRSTPSKRGDMRRRAQAAGYAAGKQGLDHKQPGVCPYTNPALIDAWSAGYVDGRRKRKVKP